MEETLDDYLKQIKIEEVVAEYVPIKRRGNNYLGLCPFHQEKSPSFVVSPQRQIFKCFGCGKSGNVVTFLMDLNSWTLKEAVEVIATKFNITPYQPGITDFPHSGRESLVTSVLRPIFQNLNANINSVIELINFDKIVLDFCIDQLQALENRIKENAELKITNIRFLPGATIAHLQNIKQHESLAPQYNSIYNQSVVLLVSYFTSAIKDIFRDTLNYWSKHHQSTLRNVPGDIKLSYDELMLLSSNLSEHIGDLIIKKRNIGFQDMQSTLKEFTAFFGISLEKETHMENVIFAQASRHAIVHALSLADEKFMAQIAHTPCRTIKIDIKLGDEIKFSVDEIDTLISSVKKFVRQLSDQLINKTIL